MIRTIVALLLALAICGALPVRAQTGPSYDWFIGYELPRDPDLLAVARKQEADAIDARSRCTAVCSIRGAATCRGDCERTFRKRILSIAGAQFWLARRETNSTAGVTRVFPLTEEQAESPDMDLRLDPTGSNAYQQTGLLSNAPALCDFIVKSTGARSRFQPAGDQCNSIVNVAIAGSSDLDMRIRTHDYTAARALIVQAPNLGPTGAEQETPLHTIAFSQNREADDIAIVRALLARGAKIDARDAQGATPLLLSISPDDYALTPHSLALTRELIKAGADVNAADNVGVTPLMRAANSLALTTELLEHGARVGGRSATGATALHAAAEARNAEVAAFLIAHGAAVNGRDADARTPIIALLSPSHVTTSAQVGGRMGSPPFMAVLRTLIKAKADVNAQTQTGRTPLFYALNTQFTGFPHLPVVQLLLTNHADAQRRYEARSALGVLNRTDLQFLGPKDYAAIALLLRISGGE